MKIRSFAFLLSLWSLAHRWWLINVSDPTRRNRFPTLPFMKLSHEVCVNCGQPIEYLLNVELFPPHLPLSFRVALPKPGAPCWPLMLHTCYFVQTTQEPWELGREQRNSSPCYLKPIILLIRLGLEEIAYFFLHLNILRSANIQNTFPTPPAH